MTPPGGSGDPTEKKIWLESIREKRERERNKWINDKDSFNVFKKQSHGKQLPLVFPLLSNSVKTIFGTICLPLKWSRTFWR
jgi:hypothetical protein